MISLAMRSLAFCVVFLFVEIVNSASIIGQWQGTNKFREETWELVFNDDSTALVDLLCCPAINDLGYSAIYVATEGDYVQRINIEVTSGENSGKLIKGIFQISDNKNLLIALGAPGAARPEGFGMVVDRNGGFVIDAERLDEDQPPPAASETTLKPKTTQTQPNRFTTRATTTKQSPGDFEITLPPIEPDQTAQRSYAPVTTATRPTEAPLSDSESEDTEDEDEFDHFNPPNRQWTWPWEKNTHTYNPSFVPPTHSSDTWPEGWRKTTHPLTYKPPAASSTEAWTRYTHAPIDTATGQSSDQHQESGGESNEHLRPLWPLLPPINNPQGTTPAPLPPWWMPTSTQAKTGWRHWYSQSRAMATPRVTTTTQPRSFMFPTVSRTTPGPTTKGIEVPISSSSIVETTSTTTEQEVDHSNFFHHATNPPKNLPALTLHPGKNNKHPYPTTRHGIDKTMMMIIVVAIGIVVVAVSLFMAFFFYTPPPSPPLDPESQPFVVKSFDTQNPPAADLESVKEV